VRLGLLLFSAEGCHEMFNIGAVVKTYRYRVGRYLFFAFAVFHVFFWVALLVYALTYYGEPEFFFAFVTLLFLILPTHVLIREIRFLGQQIVVCESGLLIKRFTKVVELHIHDVKAIAFEEFVQRGRAWAFYMHVRTSDGTTHTVNLRPYYSFVGGTFRTFFARVYPLPELYELKKRVDAYARNESLERPFRT